MTNNIILNVLMRKETWWRIHWKGGSHDVGHVTWRGKHMENTPTRGDRDGGPGSPGKVSYGWDPAFSGELSWALVMLFCPLVLRYSISKIQVLISHTHRVQKFFVAQ